MVANIEIRSATGVLSGIRTTNAQTLEGYAAVFDSPSRDLGGFTEVIKPGAFTDTLRDDSDDILALYDHDRRHILGRVGAGTLELREDGMGLAFKIEIPDTTVGRDLRVLVNRRDVAGASFAFSVPDDGDGWSSKGGQPLRTLKRVNLHEITITADPAYRDTSVAVRSRKQHCHPRLAELEAFLIQC